LKGDNLQAWSLFLLLCLIWGSSFILMKLGMFDSRGLPLLSAWQVAALRILSAGLVLLPFAYRAHKKVPAGLRWYIFLSGVLGSFIPAFLFCIAETRIDSSLAGTLNSLTPIFSMLVAVFLYSAKVPVTKIFGILVGFTGCILLFVSKRQEPVSQIGFSLFVVLATVFYGLNVNMVQHRLKEVGSLHIAALAFSYLTVPAAAVLWATGYFNLPLINKEYMAATGAAATLGIVGTALASVIFYRLVKLSGVIFSSLVTYGIPFVALAWGFYYGEQISLIQILALLVILGGVYLANIELKEWKWLAKRRPPNEA
jgi:drug/metabolite transporter (DMT)-like permease